MRDADRIVVVESGRITQMGSHAELVSRAGYYASLVEGLAERAA